MKTFHSESDDDDDELELELSFFVDFLDFLTFFFEPLEFELESLLESSLESEELDDESSEFEDFCFAFLISGSFVVSLQGLIINKHNLQSYN